MHRALVSLLLALPPLAGAHAQAQKPKKIKVTIVVILASEHGTDVDKQLKQIAEEVQRLNPKLTNFRLKSHETRSLEPEEKASFKLVDGKTAIVVVKHGADSENRVGLAVTPPGQDEIVYRCACGKYLPIITRCQTKSNERIILAIRVQPCNGK